ncbi:ABC transporter ATP-binding protein/permease [Pelagibacteraceae bacterium]|jgi:ABC-type multidrug transport system fused ATPase/permease subunit|nr:ABC transporter ATP-binding protein/permease [Pelagibacteraceae bacterium]
MLKNIKSMLTQKQMRALYFFIFLSLIATIIETAGIGLIIPFVQALMNESLNENFIKFLSILNINPNTNSKLIFYLASMIAFIFTFKVIFLTFFSFLQKKLIADLKVSLSDKLYGAYLRKPYSFHLNNNSSKLIRNVDEVGLVAFVLQSLITLTLEIFVFIGIATFVIFYEPKGSLLVILFLGSFGYLFFNKVQSKAKDWGKIRQKHAALRFKYLREGLQSIKDIKILQRSNEIIKIYTDNNKIINVMEVKQNFINSLPRLWLEWLTLMGFILLIFFMIFIGRELSYVIPLLGLFAAAAFRIMPSLTRIMNSLQNILYNRPAVDSIYKEFTEEVKDEKKIGIIASKKISLQNEIELKNVNYKYSSSDSHVIKNISLKIKNGTTIGFIGESGAGKTTLINLILGLIQPTEGRIKVDGVDISDNIQDWQKQIGYVPQDIYISDDTIRKNIAYALPDDKIDSNAIKRAVSNAKLEDLTNNLQKGLNTKVGEFGDRISGGQRQRIALARALYNNPKILILDEFTNSLDLATEKEIINEVNHLKGKKTIIMIAHRLSTLEKCDHIYKLDEAGLKLEKI